MTACRSNVKLHDVVVLLSGAIIRLLISGLWYTPGILYVAFRDEFQYSAGVTSWITTLQYFTSSVTCALGGLVVKRCGSRLVSMAGGVVMSCGLLTSMFASDISHVFITFGVLSGFGSGLSYIGSMEALNIQFSTNRNILFGICAFTGNMGIVMYPPLLQTLIDTYSWRGMFLVLGAIELNIVVVAMVFPGRTKHSQTDQIKSIERCHDPESKCYPNNYGPTTTLLYDDSDKIDHTFEEETVLDTVSNKAAADFENQKVLNKDSPKRNPQNGLAEGCDITQRRSFLQKNFFLKNKHYCLYLLSGMLYMFGSGIILGHLSAYTILNNLTDKIGASTLYTVNAMSMATTKLLQGFVISNNRLQPVTLHIILTGIGGLMTFIFLLNIPLPVLYIYAVVLGASNSSLGGALLPAINFGMSGAESFAFALGVCVCFSALGTLVGAPAAGWIYDTTQFYTIPFLVAAIAMTSSSVVMIISSYVMKRKSARRQRESS